MKKLVIDENKHFHEFIKKIRLKKGMSRSDLANLINKSSAQAYRYEQPPGNGDSSQRPPFDVLRDLCVKLQIDANSILGLKWIETKEEQVEEKILRIKRWKIKGDKLLWTCPNCNSENITYGELNDSLRHIFTLNIQCENENCFHCFNELSCKAIPEDVCHVKCSVFNSKKSVQSRWCLMKFNEGDKN